MMVSCVAVSELHLLMFLIFSKVTKRRLSLV